MLSSPAIESSTYCPPSPLDRIENDLDVMQSKAVYKADAANTNMSTVRNACTATGSDHPTALNTNDISTAPLNTTVAASEVENETKRPAKVPTHVVTGSTAGTTASGHETTNPVTGDASTPETQDSSRATSINGRRSRPHQYPNFTVSDKRTVDIAFGAILSDKKVSCNLTVVLESF